MLPIMREQGISLVGMGICCRGYAFIYIPKKCTNAQKLGFNQLRSERFPKGPKAAGAHDRCTFERKSFVRGLAPPIVRTANQTRTLRAQTVVLRSDAMRAHSRIFKQMLIL